MRKVGSWLLILASWGMLVMVYFATPYMMHAHSQMVNFLQVVACGAVVAFGVVMLSAGVVMRKPVATMPRAAKVPPVPRVPPVPSLASQLDRIGTHIDNARRSDYDGASAGAAHNRIDELSNALAMMFAIAKHNAPPTEGTK